MKKYLKIEKMDNCFIVAFLDYLKIVRTKEIGHCTTIAKSQFEIRFVKTEELSITINLLYLKPELRNQGILREFLQFIVDNKFYEMNFWIVDVLCKQLYEYLLRFKYNEFYFSLNENGFHLVSNCLKCNTIISNYNEKFVTILMNNQDITHNLCDLCIKSICDMKCVKCGIDLNDPYNTITHDFMCYCCYKNGKCLQRKQFRLLLDNYMSKEKY